MENCLECKKLKDECKCEGGFKLIYLFGKPVSKAEADAHYKKPLLERKTDEVDFMQKRLREINDKNAENMGKIILPR